MSKKPTQTDDLNEDAVAGRAKSMAYDWMRAVSLQHDRIVNPRPQDKEFHPFSIDGFHEVDVQFLVIALMRLRRIAATLEHVPEHWDSIQGEIENFDAKLPWLKHLRDVFEHLEDYAVDSDRRHSSTSRRELQTWSAGKDGLNWLGFDVNWRDAYLAAKDLYASVIRVYDSVVTEGRKNEGGL